MEALDEAPDQPSRIGRMEAAPAGEQGLRLDLMRIRQFHSARRRRRDRHSPRARPASGGQTG